MVSHVLRLKKDDVSEQFRMIHSKELPYLHRSPVLGETRNVYIQWFWCRNVDQYRERWEDGSQEDGLWGWEMGRTGPWSYQLQDCGSSFEPFGWVPAMLDNACYHFVQNILSSCLLSKNAGIKIKKFGFSLYGKNIYWGVLVIKFWGRFMDLWEIGKWAW